MGQKVNPVGLRVGVNRDWDSKWYASDKEFATFLHEDIKVREYLEKEVKDAALSTVEILRVVPPDVQYACAERFIAAIKEMGIEYESPNNN